MIFLFVSFAEKTTNNVLDYFSNSEEVFERLSIVDNQDSFYENFNLLSEDSDVFWYRKGSVPIKQEKYILQEIDRYYQNELHIAFEYTIHQLEQRKYIGNYFQRVPNKLLHLLFAQKAGLKVPKHKVISIKKDAYLFKLNHKNLINKSLRDSFEGTFDNTYYYSHTERVTEEHIESLDETFFPTLFQEEIPKAYELRVIFIHDKIWAGAIFSQSDPKTSLDWRNYNRERPNRIVPYQLPETVENNIRAFAKEAKLNTGAIDMIVTKDKRYVFLECNPNGQISMVSEHCNYPIEKYIADFLANA